MSPVNINTLLSASKVLPPVGVLGRDPLTLPVYLGYDCKSLWIKLSAKCRNISIKLVREFVASRSDSF